MPSYSLDIQKAATRQIRELEAEIRRIRRAVALISGKKTFAKATNKTRFSPEARRRMAAGNKRRWAAYRRAKKAGDTKALKKLSNKPEDK